VARNLDPKCAQCRRAGVKLFLKGERCNSAKCAMVKRNYPPGVHGVKGRGKLTSYGEQLAEKQKAKRIFGILEKQFKKYYHQAARMKGEAGDNLLRLLEMRLDNVVYRLGFAESRVQARQMVSHGLLEVNGKKVDISSFQVKIGDQITLRSKSQKSKLFSNIEEKLSKAQVPSWLALEAKSLSGKILDYPKKDEMESTFDPQIVIEFYSR